MYVCMHVWHVCIHTCDSWNPISVIYIYIYVCICICIYIYDIVFMYIYIYMLLYIYIYIYIYICYCVLELHALFHSKPYLLSSRSLRPSLYSSKNDTCVSCAHACVYACMYVCMYVCMFSSFEFYLFFRSGVRRGSLRAYIHTWYICTNMIHTYVIITPGC